MEPPVYLNKCPDISIKDDCAELFIENLGDKSVKDDQFENVDVEVSQENSSEAENNDFFVEEEEQEPSGGIKTKQFWNGMLAPSGATKPCKDKVNLAIKCQKTIGFNSLGRDNAVLIDSLICKAVGCCLVLNGEVYEKHCYRISTLSYNAASSELLSGSDGVRPELILWSYHSDSRTLSFQKRFFIGKKSDSLFIASFFGSDHVLAIEKVSPHKSSTAYIFSKDTSKKEIVKVGKCFDLQSIEIQSEKGKIQRVFIGNDTGISQLVLEPKPTVVEMVKQQGLTAILPFMIESSEIDDGNLQILFGDRKGLICASLNPSKKSKRIHEGWVFEIKSFEVNSQKYFISVGASDGKFVVFTVSEEAGINVLREFSMSGYVRSLHTESDKILVGCRDGQLEIIETTKLINGANSWSNCQQSIQFGLGSFCSTSDTRCFLRYNKFFKKYFYAKSDDKEVYFIEPNQNKLTQKDRYALRSFPQSLSTFGNLIIYSYEVYEEKEKLHTKKSSLQSSSLAFSPSKQTSIKNERAKKFLKTILVIEDFVENKLVCKLSLEDRKRNPQKCSMLEFNADGSAVAIGMESRSICILSVKQLTNQQPKFVYSEQQTKEEVEDLIWSKDGKFLKSIGLSEIYYWECKADSLTQVKSRVCKEALWVRVGKFNWESKSIWEKATMVKDITDIWSAEKIEMQKVSKSETESTKLRILGSNKSSGEVEIYNSPANGAEFKSVKLFDSPFKVVPLSEEQKELLFWTVWQGIVCLFKVTEV